MVHCCYCCWYWRSYCTTDDLLMPTATLALSLSVSASVWHDWIWFDRISVQFIRGEELWKKRAWTITGTNRLCLHINTYLERHLLESQQPTACEPLARSDMIFLCFNRAHATCGMSTWISPLCSSNQSISQSHLRSLISRNDTPNSITLIHHRLSNFQTRFGIFELKSQLLTCTLYALNWEKSGRVVSQMNHIDPAQVEYEPIQQLVLFACLSGLQKCVETQTQLASSVARLSV